MESGAGSLADEGDRIGKVKADFPRPASLRELFLAFSLLALQGFGGVLPIAHRELVERRRWVSSEQFVELLAISQVLPGPNFINMTAILGDRWFGFRGAMVALGGLMAIPLVIVLTLAGFYQGFSQVPAVAGALRGMGLVASGLVLATALKLVKTLAKNPLGTPLAAIFGIATFVLVGLLRWPLVPLVLGLGPVVIAVAYWRGARSLGGGRS